MNSYVLIAVMALTTIAIRFAPFLLFSKKTPPFILYLGSVLPYCTMAMLVVFCFRDTDTSSLYSCMPEILAGIYAILLQKWRHSSSLTIVSATVLYMLLVQRVYR
ncbi:MAG: AzlD domain-containing protein [Erysipelotrichaceae bacterium]|nr:AzlD domain-containing protein [Erysipelotrichaceae bacterium]MBQ1482909.1 AzlD domain-containing protein [Erysipelotrichaceae bacterium]